MVKDFFKLCIKIDRIAAWILLFCVILFFFSGYGMTKGIVNQSLATFIHNQLLPVLIIPAFLIHTFFSIRLAFCRWKKWNKVSRALLVFIYCLFFLIIVYFQFFFSSQKFTSENSSQDNSNT